MQPIYVIKNTLRVSFYQPYRPYPTYILKEKNISIEFLKNVYSKGQLFTATYLTGMWASVLFLVTALSTKVVKIQLMTNNLQKV